MTNLQSNLQVTGIPVLTVWLKSDAKDFNLFAFLEDVSEDGTSTAVTDGVIRASRRSVSTPPWGDEGLGIPFHRDFRVDEDPLVPGTRVEMQFDLYATSYVFRAGHRLRLSLTTAIGEAASPEAEWLAHPAHIQFLTGAQFPSGLKLPVVPKGSSVYKGEVTTTMETGRPATRPAELYVGRSAVYLKVGEQWCHWSVRKRTGSEFQLQIAGENARVVTTHEADVFRATITSSRLRFTGIGSDQ